MVVANPKSAITTSLFSLKIRFAGLRSLWMTDFEWRYSTPCRRLRRMVWMSYKGKVVVARWSWIVPPFRSYRIR